MKNNDVYAACLLSNDYSPENVGLFMTSLKVSPLGVTGSVRNIETVPFPEELNITRIVNEIYSPFLTFDSDHTKQRVTRKLYILASLVNTLPRTLEF